MSEKVVVEYPNAQSPAGIARYVCPNQVEAERYVARLVKAGIVALKQVTYIHMA